MRVVPLPLRAPSLPPKTERAPVCWLASQAKLDPGSSLNTKLIVAAPPFLTAATLALTATVGAPVSIAIDKGAPAPPLLPAGSR